MRLTLENWKKILQTELIYYAAAVMRHQKSKSLGIINEMKTREAAEAIKVCYSKMEKNLEGAIHLQVKEEKERIIKILTTLSAEYVDDAHLAVEEAIKRVKENPLDGLKIGTGTGSSEGQSK